jgi:hypothetical protein
MVKHMLRASNIMKYHAHIAGDGQWKVEAAATATYRAKIAQ